MRRLNLLAAAAILLSPRLALAAPIPPGNASQNADLPGATLQVFTHLPPCTPRLLLLVFHGVGRNAGPYRDHAVPLADQLCAVVVAPLFDHARFPRDRYQYGDVASGHASTLGLLPPLIAWSRAAANTPDLPVVLLGHSAGAQFLDRAAAFADLPGVRIVLANPSTWVLPTHAAPPFGFGDAPPASMRAYLARPLGILLGGNDTGTKDLATAPEAMAQGPNRLARGRAAFALAKDVAQSHGWPFGWTLAEVPGIGHNATQMLASPQAAAAVDPR